MADVTVNQSHNVSPAEARQRLGAFEDMMGKYGVSAKWKGDSAKLKGLGVSGGIDVTSSEVKVVVKLGMMAKAAGVDAGRLTNSIAKRLKAAFEE